MNKEIRNILLLFLKERTITASWGISNIKILPNTISFSVKAMMYKGVIQISPIDTTDCKVHLVSKGDFQCNTKDLVSKLDCLIEKSDNYYTNLFNWFNLRNKRA